MTIDDELIITIRVRIPAGLSDLDQMGIAGTVAGGVVGSFEDQPGKLRGIEVAMPTFERYPEPVGETQL